MRPSKVSAVRSRHFSTAACRSSQIRFSLSAAIDLTRPSVRSSPRRNRHSRCSLARRAGPPLDPGSLAGPPTPGQVFAGARTAAPLPAAKLRSARPPSLMRQENRSQADWRETPRCLPMSACPPRGSAGCRPPAAKSRLASAAKFTEPISGSSWSVERSEASGSPCRRSGSRRSRRYISTLVADEDEGTGDQLGVTLRLAQNEQCKASGSLSLVARSSLRRALISSRVRWALGFTRGRAHVGIFLAVRFQPEAHGHLSRLP